MNKYVVVAVITAMAVAGMGLGAGIALAQDEAPKPVGVILTGENYCLLCTLAKSEVGNANAAYAHLNALKVTAAKDVDGNELAELVGKTVHYLPSKSCEELLVGEKYEGKTITVIGKLFKNENALLVETVEAANGDDEDDWDELPVGKMSGLQVL